MDELTRPVRRAIRQQGEFRRSAPQMGEPAAPAQFIDRCDAWPPPPPLRRETLHLKPRGPGPLR